MANAAFLRLTDPIWLVKKPLTYLSLSRKKILSLRKELWNRCIFPPNLSCSRAVVAGKKPSISSTAAIWQKQWLMTERQWMAAGTLPF
ncbi:hypothetical protein CEXT_618851 [Caerostris extrusa]|uniref:Uncharacterized protein n=1 Tax=Caerostris extrusa TaxID=172846 RepID=A0AAV4MHS6_CAEEX|nr:hypothetical protein CEXT_618851 [Caerostris extrusa]